MADRVRPASEVVRWLATVCCLVEAMLLGGCVSTGTVESYWIIYFEGDSGTAIRALEQSSLALGGKQLGEAGGTGASYTFGDRSLSFRLNRDSIAAYGGDVAIGRRQQERGERKLNALINDIVAKASHDSQVPVTLALAPAAEIPAPPTKIGGTQIAGADPHFKEYGGYLQRVIDTVDKQWTAGLIKSNTYPPPGTWVAITFILAPDGTTSQITSVDSHTTPNGERLALAGLTAHLPFEPWTPEMKAKLNPAGEKLVFTFYYQ